MSIQSVTSTASLTAARPLASGHPAPPASLHSDAAQPSGQDSELRETFNQFVGETFFGQMLKAMRSTVGKPAYFHGGQAEEIFQGQLDQVLSEKMTQSGGGQFSDAMFKLFELSRA